MAVGTTAKSRSVTPLPRRLGRGRGASFNPRRTTPRARLEGSQPRTPNPTDREYRAAGRPLRTKVVRFAAERPEVRDEQLRREADPATACGGLRSARVPARSRPYGTLEPNPSPKLSKTETVENLHWRGYMERQEKRKSQSVSFRSPNEQALRALSLHAQPSSASRISPGSPRAKPRRVEARSTLGRRVGPVGRRSKREQPAAGQAARSSSVRRLDGRRSAQRSETRAAAAADPCWIRHDHSGPRVAGIALVARVGVDEHRADDVAGDR